MGYYDRPANQMWTVCEDCGCVVDPDKRDAHDAVCSTRAE